MSSSRYRFSSFVLILCVLVYLWQSGSAGDDPVYRFGVYGPAIRDGEWYRLVTAGFLHTGAVHLFMNMLSLYVLARLVEPAFPGRPLAFPFLYLAALIGGSLGAMLLDFDTVAIGASGAIYGLMGAAIGIPLRRGLGWNRTGVAPWIAFNVVFSVAVPGISLGGHLGGLLTGFLIGWLLG